MLLTSNTLGRQSSSSSVRSCFALRSTIQLSAESSISELAVGQERFELSTPRLSSVCSNQLSYWPAWIGLSRPNSKSKRKDVRLTRIVTTRGDYKLQKGGDPTAGSPTVTLLRLHPSHQSLFRRLPHEVGAPTSRATDSHGVTGGVYKARERIHRCHADQRLLAIPTSRSRVADSYLY